MPSERNSRVAGAPRIAVLEDDPSQAKLMASWLESQGYAFRVFGRGGDMLRELLRETYDLAILDWRVPDLSGEEVLRALRKSGREPLPVLFATAQNREEDIVHMLKAGADDYLTKPLRRMEFLARVEALLRRRPDLPGAARSAPTQGTERFGDVAIDLASRTVSRAGNDVEVAPKEYELLVALVSRRGAVVSRLELMREVWGYSDAVISRTIDTHVAELRRKLEEDPGDPRHILTVRKVGYRLKG